MTDAGTFVIPEDPTPEELIEGLLAVTRLEQIDDNIFRGPRSHEPWLRVFGGQVVAQALLAACHTVKPERLPHSLHAYFLRPGDNKIPIVFQVERDRDGAAFSSRRVVALQHGKPILNLSASFQKAEPGYAHQHPMPDVPAPEGLEVDREIAARHLDIIPENRRGIMLRKAPIEFRPIGPAAPFAPKGPPTQSYWFRAVAPLPDDPVLHRVLIAYASDMNLIATSMIPHGISWMDAEVQEASLDHAVWLHEDVRVDDWLLFTQESPWSGHSRGMNRGAIYSRDGKLVATVAQEGLMRLLPKK